MYKKQKVEHATQAENKEIVESMRGTMHENKPKKERRATTA
jgi:hypothetical protein